MPTILVRLALSVACVCAGARAEVFVLDAAGGGDFTTLQQAAWNVSDGDIVLVRPGDYFHNSPFGGVQFGDTSITLVSDGSGVVDFPDLRIKLLSAGKSFVLRGVRLGKIVSPGAPARLLVQDCQGAVLLQECVLAGIGGAATLPTAAVRVINANVTLESCVLEGGAGTNYASPVGYKAGPGNVALHAVAARLSLTRCTLTGGKGGKEGLFSPDFGAAAGAAALHAEASELWLSGSSVTGGDGGTDTGTPVASGPPAGGAGVLADAGSLIHLRANSVTGGQPGSDAQGPGAAGPALDAPPSVVVMLPGPARTLWLNAPLVAGDAGLLVATGAPGELVALLLAPEGGWASVPKFGGPLLVGSGVPAPFVLGVIEVDGQLRLPFTAPDLGLLPDSGVRLIAQVVVLSGPASVLGGSSPFVELAANP